MVAATVVLLPVLLSVLFTLSCASLYRVYLPSHLGRNADSRNAFQSDLIPILNTGGCDFYARMILWESMSNGLYRGNGRKEAERAHRYGCRLREYLLIMILVLSGDIA